MALIIVHRLFSIDAIDDHNNDNSDRSKSHENIDNKSGS
jgi:hypothetical protein